MTQGLWSMHGLVVRSDDVALDARPAAPGLPEDLTIRFCGHGAVLDRAERPNGRLMASVDSDGRPWLTVIAHRQVAMGDPTRDVELVDVHFHGVARATIDPVRRTVDLVLGPDVDEDLASVLVNGTVISVVLMVLGYPVLHASAVTVLVGAHRMAIGFVGSSGMGKSTLATLACRDGAQLLADDVLRVDVRDGEVIAWPGSLTTRLRPAALELAEQSSDRLAATADGRTATTLESAPASPARLAALVIPRPDRAASAVGIERLRGVSALLALASHPRVMGWRDPKTAALAHWHAGALVRDVPVLVSRVPWGPPFREGLGQEVVQAVLVEAGRA